MPNEYPCTQENIINPQHRPRILKNILTHIQLSNEARKVVVFEILGKDFAGKSSLIVNKESASILQEKKLKGRNHLMHL